MQKDQKQRNKQESEYKKKTGNHKGTELCWWEIMKAMCNELFMHAITAVARITTTIATAPNSIFTYTYTNINVATDDDDDNNGN